jgi:hypothetical protein
MSNKKECSNTTGAILYVFSRSDWKRNKDGQLVLKRKYGKFNRKGFIINDSSTNKTDSRGIAS